MVDAKSTSASADSSATVAPQLVSQNEDVPARGIPRILACTNHDVMFYPS
jgi:hypothetical protein